MSLLDLQRTAGNAAVTARLEQLADTVPTPRVDPHLPRGLSAYTVNGEIHVNPRVALLPGPEVSRILRHEAVHSAHQRLWAPLNRTDEGEQARSRAERAAVDGERGFRAWTHLLRPAPSVLAYPGTDYGPWPTVWVGKAGVIAQMQVGDVTIRLFRSYSRLKITKAPQDKTFECGDHARAPIPTLAARMTAVAQQVVDVNAKIPKGAPERVTMVLAPESDEPGYRLLNGTGAIVLDTANFNPESAAHEASHALFELHSGRSAASPRPPTRLALAVAELFSALRSTKNVPIPTRAFDAKKGRPGRTDRKRLSPAGVVMVSDTLWAGRGGHPWDGADEFFASALGAHLRQKALLGQIIDYYQTKDPVIGGQRARLTELLETANGERKPDKLGAPSDEKEAEAVLKATRPAPTLHAIGGRGWLIDPTTMAQASSPPSCTTARKRKKGKFDDFIEK